jgi:hypothetical protein
MGILGGQSSGMGQAKADDLQAPIERLLARRGEVLRAWGPTTLDDVTIARFEEAEGWPVRGGDLSPAILLQLGNARVDVHADQRPHESLDDALKNPVNGGTAVWWFRAVRRGETMRGETRLGEARMREGKSGPMALVVLETRFFNDAKELVGRTEKTMIFRDVA